MKSITIELMVEDIGKTVEFYKNILGFNIVLNEPKENPVFTIIENNKVKIMLYYRGAFVKEVPEFSKWVTGGTVALYINVEDIEMWYEKLKDKVEIIQKLYLTSYNSKEFSFKDINGYVLIFSE